MKKSTIVIIAVFTLLFVLSIIFVLISGGYIKQKPAPPEVRPVTPVQPFSATPTQIYKDR